MNFTTRSFDKTTPSTNPCDNSVNSYFTPEKGVPIAYEKEDALDCNSEGDDEDEMDLLMREGVNVQKDMDDDLG
jgi:hypothetical protein